MRVAPARSSVWRNPSFVLLWGSQFVSALGTKVSGLAMPLLVLALTDSPAQAGFLASARMLPYLVLGLPAGALVERMNKKSVLVVCDIVRFVALCSVPVAWHFGVLSLAQLYAVSLVQGAAFVFFNVAEYAALTAVIETDQLAQATALDSTAWSTASLVGPGFAGEVIGIARSATAGAVLGFLADGITFLISVVSLLFLRMQTEPGESLPAPNTPSGTFQDHVSLAPSDFLKGGMEDGRTSQTPRPRSTMAVVLEDVRAGLLFVSRNPPMRWLAISATFLSFIFAPVSLGMIVLAKGSMHASPSTVGLIFSTAAGGGILGSLVAPAISKRWRVGPVLATSVSIQALATVVVGLAASPIGLALGWTVAFFLDPVLNTSAAAYRLRQTPGAFQARVQSIFRLGSYGGEPLGSAVGGVAISIVGARSLILGVAFAVALWSLALWRSALRTAE